MKRLIAVIAVALTLTFVAACNPDDTGTEAPGLESPGGLESPSGLESMAPVSPSAS